MNLIRIIVIGLLLIAGVGCSTMASSYPKLDLPKDSTIVLYGDVTVNSVSDVIKLIHKLDESGGVSPIYLCIRTDGGDVLAGFELVDAMESSRRPVYTVAIGITASMGAVIHSYGVKRYMTPRAILMYHDFSLGAGGDTKINILQEELKFVAQYMAEANDNISKRSGVPVAELYQREANEWWVRADEASSRNLVDGVVDATNYPMSNLEDSQ